MQNARGRVSQHTGCVLQCDLAAFNVVDNAGEGVVIVGYGDKVCGGKGLGAGVGNRDAQPIVNSGSLY